MGKTEQAIGPKNDIELVLADLFEEMAACPLAWIKPIMEFDDEKSGVCKPFGIATEQSVLATLDVNLGDKQFSIGLSEDLRDGVGLDGSDAFRCVKRCRSSLRVTDVERGISVPDCAVYGRDVLMALSVASKDNDICIVRLDSDDFGFWISGGKPSRGKADIGAGVDDDRSFPVTQEAMVGCCLKPLM